MPTLQPSRRPSDSIQSSLVARGTVARQIYQMHGGDIQLRNVDYPSFVAPGGILDVEAQVVNVAQILDSLDDDYCGGYLDPDGGLRYQIEFSDHDGEQQVTQSTCLESGNNPLGWSETTESWSMTVPDETGHYSFQVRMKMDSAGGYDAEETREFTYTVREDAGIRPGDDEDGGIDIPWGTILLAFGGIAGAAIVVPQLPKLLD